MKPLDLVVIGGGISGLGVARLAARNGLAVAVLERGDIASETSSRSSHMLHGGLRYLEHGHFALIREALQQRRELLHMAPALAHPVRFLVPLYRKGRVAPWKMHAGLALYDWLAGRDTLSPHGSVPVRDALALEPGLEQRGLMGAGLYSDVVEDDARLAVAVARDAADHGAGIHTYTEALASHPAQDGAVQIDARDRLSGARTTFEARAVVNATGPWSDEMRRTLLRGLFPGKPDPPKLLRPSRGSHLVFPSLTRGHALLFFAKEDGRVIFAIPFEGWTLVGTTEVEVGSPPEGDELLPSLGEIRYLRRELANVLPATGEMVAHRVFAGVRPLLRTGSDVGSATREHAVVADSPVFTLAGGKYTTFRIMARDVMKRVAAHLEHRAPLVDPAAPLPAPPVALTHQELGERAASQHFARTLEDVLRRRSALWLEPDGGRVAAPLVARGMASALGWSEAHVREAVQAYDAALHGEESLLRRAAEAK